MTPRDRQPRIHRWVDIVRRHEYWTLAILLAAINFWIFRDFLVLSKAYIFKDVGSDTYNQAYPFLAHIADYIRTEGIPRWSFNTGMGQNIFPGDLNNPFRLILVLLGKQALPFAIVYVEVLKIILSGMIFYALLKKLSVGRYARLIGAVLFSFSGYLIIGSGWYGHSTFVLAGIFYFFAVEKLYQDGFWPLVPLAVLLILSRSPFYLYILSFFLLIYIILRFSADNGWNPRALSALLFKVAAVGALGLAMSAVFTASDLARIFESPRVGGQVGHYGTLMSQPILTPANPYEMATGILRTFSSDLLGTGSAFKGWYNYLEAPAFYCGLVILLLFPQVFLYLPKRKLILFGTLAALCLLIILFPFYRYALYLFSGNYYKGGVSFIIPLAMLFAGVFALDALCRGCSIRVDLLIVTLVMLTLLVYFPYPGVENAVDSDIQGLVTVFLCIYALLLVQMGQRDSSLIRWMLLAVIILEVGLFTSISLEQRLVVTSDELRQKTGYNDFTLDAVAWIKRHDPSFFRISKDYYSVVDEQTSLNEGLYQNYYGTTSYHQFNQKYYIRFLRGARILEGDDEMATRWAIGLIGRPILRSLVSVKYHLNHVDDSWYETRAPALARFRDSTYEQKARIENINIMQNRYVLPIGFTYDQYIPSDDFKRIKKECIDAAMFNAFVAEDNSTGRYAGLSRLDPHSLRCMLDAASFRTVVNRLGKEAFQIESHSQNRIRGYIELDHTKMVFFSIPFDKGWQVVVNGQKVVPDLINFGFMGILLDPGRHTIEMTFYPPFYYVGGLVSVLTFLLYGSLWIRTRGRVTGKQP